MLNSAEHEILNVHKYENVKKLNLNNSNTIENQALKMLDFYTNKIFHSILSGKRIVHCNFEFLVILISKKNLHVAYLW